MISPNSSCTSNQYRNMHRGDTPISPSHSALIMPEQPITMKQEIINFNPLIHRDDVFNNALTDAPMSVVKNELDTITNYLCGNTLSISDSTVHVGTDIQHTFPNITTQCSFYIFDTKPSIEIDVSKNEQCGASYSDKTILSIKSDTSKIPKSSTGDCRKETVPEVPTKPPTLGDCRKETVPEVLTEPTGLKQQDKENRISRKVWCRHCDKFVWTLRRHLRNNHPTIKMPERYFTTRDPTTTQPVQKIRTRFHCKVMDCATSTSQIRRHLRDVHKLTDDAIKEYRRLEQRVG